MHPVLPTSRGTDSPAGASRAGGSHSDTQISTREHEVLLLVLEGATNAKASRDLGIAEVTVKKHLTSIHRKLGVSDRRGLRRSFAQPGATGESR